MNLFEKLNGQLLATKKIRLQRGTAISQDLILDDDSEILEFDVKVLSTQEITEIDKLNFNVQPKAIYEQRASKDGKGFEQVFVRMDNDDPEFKKRRLDILRQADFLTVLYGCPQLAKDTPGETLDAKMDQLNKNVPYDVIANLATAIRSHTYGHAEAESFGDPVSTDSPSLESSTPGIEAGRKKKSNDDSPPSTDTTNA